MLKDYNGGGSRQHFNPAMGTTAYSKLKSLRTEMQATAIQHNTNYLSIK